jgi:hypothetical protein
MTIFGDIEPEDVFDAAGHPDPEQVARRLHEIISALRVLSGGVPLPPWHLWDRRGLEIAAIAPSVDNLTLGNADDFAETLHEERRILDPLPAWDDLTAEEREVATSIAHLIIAWLLAEGSLR